MSGHLDKLFLVIKPDTFDRTSRFYPDVIVATKSDVSAEMSGHFPAVIAATTPDVCDVTSGHKTIFLTRHQDIFLTALVATNNWCF